MRRIVTTLALIVLCAAPALAANQVRISQVYGGGGAASGTPTYNQDYVEIFNSGATPVNISGWQIAYGSAAGNWASAANNQFTFGQGVILQPCQYLYVAFGTPSAAGAPLPVTPDFTGPINMSATSGKVALFNAAQANIACGAEPGGSIVDKVSYGTGNCPENTNVGTLSNAQGAVRNSNGNADTDNNLNDFTIVGNPVPRNTSSFDPTCLATPTRSSTWGNVKAIYR